MTFSVLLYCRTIAFDKQGWEKPFFPFWWKKVGKNEKKNGKNRKNWEIKKYFFPKAIQSPKLWQNIKKMTRYNKVSIDVLL